ncbi:MAG: sulfatase [Myxococcota bacterium]|nr:sulfatase [Myxococcota bacterium]
MRTKRSAETRKECAAARGCPLWLGLVFLLAALGLACQEPRQPPNFILITLDTTRPDHLGPYGYAGADTPNLDRFAQRAQVYERAYATSSWTLASHASILTGLLPRQHGAQSMPTGANRSLGYGVRPLADSFLTLAEILSAAGYRTGAVVAGPALRGELGTAQGFEIYHDELDGNDRRFHGKRAEETTDLALEIIRQFGAEPFFLFVNYFDAHAPYAPPEGFSKPPAASPEREDENGTPVVVRFIERLSAGTPARPVGELPPDERAQLETALAGYDAEITYLDHHLGRLLDAIDRLPAAEESWIFVTGDHGESFGEHYFLSHGAHLYEDNVRVPLLVRAPGSRALVRLDKPVQNHALFGTILQAAGLARPDWAEPLPAEGEGMEVVLEVHRSDSNIKIGGEFFDRDLFALIDDSAKLIRSSRGPTELFDLEADPEELDNLKTSRPDLRVLLEARLDELHGERPPLYPEPGNLELRKETEDSLRAMGYIE